MYKKRVTKSHKHFNAQSICTVKSTCKTRTSQVTILRASLKKIKLVRSNEALKNTDRSHSKSKKYIH